jgi:cystathionine beta-synthase
VAYQRMKLYDVSQLPVLDKGKVVGFIDESDLLLATGDDPARLRDRVRDVMATRVRTVPVGTHVRELLPMFAAGLVPIVVDGDEVVGLVTRIDVLNWLRRNLQ